MDHTKNGTLLVRKKYFCESCKIPIQLLKCDIEGAEHDFLLNQDISIFKFICMEIHGEEAKFDKMVAFISETHNIITILDKVIIAKLKTWIKKQTESITKA